MNSPAANTVRTIRTDVADPGTVDLETREQLRQVMESDTRFSQARIAKEIGFSSAVLSQWLAGNYAGKNDGVEHKVRAWLEAHYERLASGGLPQAPEWVETPSSERVLDGLRYAQLASDMVIIYGGAGLGKTKAIERYVKSAPNVWHLTAAPSSRGVVACLAEIARAIGLRDYIRTADVLHRQICKRLEATNGLLVVDEAQHLNVEALEQIRSIHDAAKVGVALVGNETIYSRMTAGNRAPYLDRLFSRIGKRIKLGKASEGDVDKMMKAWEINDKDCRAQIRDIANKPGALRVLTKTLRLAASYAQAESKALCCEHVRAAWRELGGLE
jgi:DNA transposition AAA+ family ATPase